VFAAAAFNLSHSKGNPAKEDFRLHLNHPESKVFADATEP
jgi:hypothetical protein